MAHKSALDLVVSQMIPVDPEGGQSAYFRSAKSIQTSGDLISLQQCVGDVLRGMNPGSQSAARDAFQQASEGCKNNDYNAENVTVNLS